MPSTPRSVVAQLAVHGLVRSFCHRRDSGWMPSRVRIARGWRERDGSGRGEIDSSFVPPQTRRPPVNLPTGGIRLDEFGGRSRPVAWVIRHPPRSGRRSSDYERGFEGSEPQGNQPQLTSPAPPMTAGCAGQPPPGRHLRPAQEKKRRPYLRRNPVNVRHRGRKTSGSAAARVSGLLARRPLSRPAKLSSTNARQTAPSNRTRMPIFWRHTPPQLDLNVARSNQTSERKSDPNVTSERKNVRQVVTGLLHRTAPPLKDAPSFKTVCGR
jgi:hypothetical protein